MENREYTNRFSVWAAITVVALLATGFVLLSGSEWWVLLTLGIVLWAGINAAADYPLWKYHQHQWKQFYQREEARSVVQPQPETADRLQPAAEHVEESAHAIRLRQTGSLVTRLPQELRVIHLSMFRDRPYWQEMCQWVSEDGAACEMEREHWLRLAQHINDERGWSENALVKCAGGAIIRPTRSFNEIVNALAAAHERLGLREPLLVARDGVYVPSETLEDIARYIVAVDPMIPHPDGY